MLYNIIKQLQETSSTNDKLAIMEQHKDNMLFKEYMRLVSCPSVNFYITAKTFPDVEGEGDGSLDEGVLDGVTYHLAKRNITGKQALSWIAHTMQEQSPEQAELLKMLLLKDVRAKVGVTLVNKVWSKLCVDVPYQRCSLPDEKNLKAFSKGETFIVQTKSDGQFAALVLETAEWFADVQVYTRNGSCYPQWFADYIAEGLNDNNAVYEGELLCYRNGQMLSRKEGNGILNSILQGGELPEGVDVLYTVWNRLQLNEWKEGKTDTKYSICFDNALFKLTKCKPKHMQMIDHCYVHSLDSAYEFNKEQLAKGLEGSIIKTLTHKWKNGTSKECLKLKVEAEIDLVVLDIEEATGKDIGCAGNIVAKSSCGKVVTGVTCNGKQEHRRYIWDNNHEYKGVVFTCVANDLLDKEGCGTLSLFLARSDLYNEVRKDKTEADSLERIEQIFNAAKHIA